MNATKWNDRLIILRCCRDWPCHEGMAYAYKGRCGLCKEIPTVVNEEYPIPTSHHTDYQQS